MIVDNGKYYLYRHIRMDNNEPFYIGIGKKNKVFFKSYKSEYKRAFDKNKRNLYWKSIVKSANYKTEILLESNDVNFICKKEEEFIDLYGRKNLGTGVLCNLCCGGKSSYNYKGVAGNRTEYKSKTAYLYNGLNGIFISKFNKLQDVCKYTGIKANRVYLICKQKLNYKGYIYSDEYLGNKIDIGKFKIRNSNGVARKVYKLDLYNGSVLSEFDNIQSAAKSVGVTKSAISYALNNMSNCSGFYWSNSYPIDINNYNTGIEKICKISFNRCDILCEYNSISDASKIENITVQSIWASLKNKSFCNGGYWVFYKDVLNNVKFVFKERLHKSVGVFDINGVLLNKYNKVCDAASFLGVNSGRISNASKNNLFYKIGYWKYLN